MDKKDRKMLFDIKIEQIGTPKIHVTEMAEAQLGLMKSMDPTLKERPFRVCISGKECNGFTYSVGPDEFKENDFQIHFHLEQDKIDITFVMDPFAAYYLQSLEIDFVQDFSEEVDQEGFVIKNLDQKKFHGKFWRKSPDLAPPEVTN
ncbi:MAG: hypothetical protein ACPGJV_04440 [Bacteriovoracaceae bacterium]